DARCSPEASGSTADASSSTKQTASSAPTAARSCSSPVATTFAASAALLIPGQSRQALGIELMPIAPVYMTLSALATFRATHSRQGVSRDRLARFFFGELSAGLIFAGGLGLLVHALGGAYLVAAGITSVCSARRSRSGCFSSASSSSGTR